MACPAVTGSAARLLSLPANAHILDMTRDQDRSDEMARVLLRVAIDVGFPADYQGQGLLTP
jgi:hypothetical protein